MLTRQQQVAAMLIALGEDDVVDGESRPWANKFVLLNTDALHEGDCPHVEKPAPFTCSRCVVNRAMTNAHKIMTLVLEK